MNIHLHVANGDTVALISELENGASVEVRDEQGRTPLMVAAASPKADAAILRILLNHGADVNATSLPKKILELDDDTRAILEESGIDTSIYDQLEGVDSVLSCAVRTATHDKIRILLEAGADVN